MRTHLITALLAVAAAAPATAQTSRCYWVGNIWTCNQTQPVQPSGTSIDWSIAKGDSFSESLRQGREIGEDIRKSRQSRAERERAEAEADLYRAQAEAIRNQGLPGTARPALSSDYMSAWTTAAAARRGLYPDFDKVVFAREVNITPDMVRLMTSSPMAADIAYYLATHRAEATAISRMPLLEAARAIDRIESELKAGADN